jgi:uncharacterized membrane protein
MEVLAELHPFFVHFPIALFVFYAMIEIWSAFSKKELFGKTAMILLFAVVVTAVLAALTGNQAEAAAAEIVNESVAFPKEMIEQHESFATYSIWFFIFLLALRFYFFIKKKLSGNIKYLFAVLAIVGCILILITGKLGGDLVYKYGVGTPLFN